MKYIRLNTGTLVVVDDEDFEWLNQWKWYESRGYAVRKPWVKGTGKSPKVVFMHRLIVGTPSGMHTDHKNKCTIDNRRSNLRTATCSQNIANSGKRRNNQSGYKGVSKSCGCNRWFARIRVNWKQINLGSFASPEEAHEAYKVAAKQYFGEFARSE